MKNKGERTEEGVYGSVTAELSALYEISSLSFSDSEEDLVEEAMEKAVRLFGVHYFALFTGRQSAASWGFRDEEEAWQKLKQNEPNQFHFAFGKEGEQGELFMEQAHPIDDRERRLYTIFARRLEKALSATRSIVERNRVSEALRKSEEKYRVTFEHTGTCMAILEEDTTISMVNSQFERLSGYSREEIEGKMSWTKFVHPDDVKRMLEYHDKRRKNPDGVPKEYEFRAVNKSGDIFNMLINIDLIPGTKRSVISLVDVTELKQMEEELQTILDSVPVGIFYMDSGSRFVRVNEVLAKRYGMTPGDFKGKTSKELFPEQGDEYIESDREVLESGEPQTGVTHKIKTPAGVRWVRLDKVPLKDADGNVTGIIGFELDITEQKEAEKELQESEERYSSLIESTDDSVYLVDRDCRYLFVNAKHLSRLGFTMDEIRGRTYGELHSPEEAAEFGEKVEEVFKTGKPVQQEHRSRRDGRYFLRTLSPVKDSEGRVTAVTVVSKEITELKRAEEERARLLKELEAKNTELERFTYSVSHDLRSPLMTIRGFAAIMREDLEQGKTGDMESYLERIESAGAKMERLLNDTLELSRIGRVANPPEDVPFGEIVKGALEQTAEQIKSSGVEVAVAEDFPTVHVDRMRIEEVLVNLITNSIQYRGEEPYPKIEIGYRIDNGERVFFVKDNGIGIEESEHEKVFELFYRLDRSSGGGTGAGLAIVKRIIEVHGGRIWIESEKGKGCTVCFTLPVA
ncbi:MAG: PAS domain-containing sensor histidine kinase [Candidatus Methanospirareceae archaeon]